MSVVMMSVLQVQVESLTRQLEQVTRTNAELTTENERVRKLLDEFALRHDRDQAQIEQLLLEKLTED